MSRFIKVIISGVRYQRFVARFTGSSGNEPASGIDALNIGADDHLVAAGRSDCLSDNFKEQAENGERQMHGTGLGLPISRSLVRAHGGELWAESEAGEGSAFFFTLPVERRSTS